MSALQAAEKLNGRGKKCQGTTSVVPQMTENKGGLQPQRDVLRRFLPNSSSFSAARSTDAEAPHCLFESLLLNPVALLVLLAAAAGAWIVAADFFSRAAL